MEWWVLEWFKIESIYFNTPEKPLLHERKMSSVGFERKRREKLKNTTCLWGTKGGSVAIYVCCPYMQYTPSKQIWDWNFNDLVTIIAIGIMRYPRLLIHRSKRVKKDKWGISFKITTAAPEPHQEGGWFLFLTLSLCPKTGWFLFSARNALSKYVVLIFLRLPFSAQTCKITDRGRKHTTLGQSCGCNGSELLPMGVLCSNHILSHQMYPPTRKGRRNERPENENKEGHECGYWILSEQL